MSCKAGLLVPLSKSARLGPRINDRFVLGGPNTLRGFRHGSIGPRDGGILNSSRCFHRR